MKIVDMEMRLEFLRGELQRELHLLERRFPPEASTQSLSKRERKACVGKILLELGALQMRLMEADRR